MVEACRIWRLFPAQIESDLALHYGRSIGEWHRRDFTMSSRELLVLLDGLPETSKFKEASERTFWLAEFTGEGELKGKLLQVLAVGDPPTDVKVITTYVDWTFDRKLLARNAREVATQRADGNGYYPDLTGLTEPTQEVLQAHQQAQDDKMRDRMADHIRAGLYGNTKGGE